MAEQVEFTRLHCIAVLTVPESRREARKILSHCSAILGRLCQYDTHTTRLLVQRCPSLGNDLQREATRDPACRHLAECVESEEECAREEERRTGAAVVVQAAWRGRAQRQQWRVLRAGVVALQRLARARRVRRAAEAGRASGEAAFTAELGETAGRVAGLEQRYRTIARLPAARLQPFLAWERSRAAGRIQRWWRRLRAVEARSGARAGQREREERAALVLQAAARRWLLGRQERAERWLGPGQQQRLISTQRARELRREVELRLQSSRYTAASPAQPGEAQARYARLCAGLPARRRAEHRQQVGNHQPISFSIKFCFLLIAQKLYGPICL